MDPGTRDESLDTVFLACMCQLSRERQFLSDDLSTCLGVGLGEGMQPFCQNRRHLLHRPDALLLTWSCSPRLINKNLRALFRESERTCRMDHSTIRNYFVRLLACFAAALPRVRLNLQVIDRAVKQTPVIWVQQIYIRIPPD